MQDIIAYFENWNTIDGIIIAVIGGIILIFILKSLGFIKRIFKNILEKLRHRLWKTKPRRLLIYISLGGTCRDPMAKAITEQIVKDMSLPFHIEIEALALGPPTKKYISYAAKNAIKEIYNKDLIGHYVPRRVTEDIIEKADLILVMDKSLMAQKIFPKSKTYLFKEFFGLSGDIIDPWPDGKDQETLNIYKKCAIEIKETIESNPDNLVHALHV